MVRGIEPPNDRIDRPGTGPVNPGEDETFQEGSASGAALESEVCVSDPDLAVIIERWEALPRVVRAGIVAMVRSTGARED